MRKYVVNKSMNIINNKYNFSEIRQAEIKYGLECVYIFITKTIVIFLLAFLFGVFKELFLLMIFYSVLRATGFGLHAKESWHCWIVSTIIFLLAPILSTHVVLTKEVILAICIICIAFFFVYAPADTEKRPIVSKKRRTIYKVLCCVTALIYSIIVLFITNNILINIILFSMIIEVIMILPISYKLLNLKYNNYKSYLQNSLS